MPQINGIVRCVNHPDETVIKEIKLNTLLAIEGTNIQQAGLVLQVYRCPICGYCELYYADEDL